MKKLTIAAVVVGATAVTIGLALYGLKKLCEDFKNCDFEDDDIMDECADCDSDCENCTCDYACNCKVDEDINKEDEPDVKKKECECGDDCACEGECDETCDCKEDCDCKKETEE